MQLHCSGALAYSLSLASHGRRQWHGAQLDSLNGSNDAIEFEKQNGTLNIYLIKEKMK
jgi:hypothetical protein